MRKLKMGRNRNANVLLDALEQALKSGVFSKSGEEFVIHCPFCGDKAGHHYVNVSKKVSYCFRKDCKVSVSFKTQFVGHSVKNYLQSHNLVRGTKTRQPLEVDVNYPLVPVLDVKENDQFWALKSAIGRIYEYCISRGMTHRQIVDYQVSAKPFEARAYFPYWDDDGKIIFWMGRALGNHYLKTIEKKGASKPLYGRHVKKWDSSDPIVLVEGVFDHFATPNSYALMGSGITKDQIKQLVDDNVERVFVIGDPDADSAAQGICKKLLSEYVLAFPVQLAGTDKDPADLGRGIMTKIVEELANMPTLQRSQQLRVDVSS